MQPAESMIRKPSGRVHKTAAAAPSPKIALVRAS